jgi:hypothetical protein
VKNRLLVATAVLLASTVSTGPLRAQTPQPPPAPPAAAPAATIAGKWNVSIDTGQGVMETILEVKLDGKKVTGTLSGQQGTSPIEGEYNDPKLTFSMNYDAGGNSIAVFFTCTLKDNVLTGTADAGSMGSFPVRAERAKDK